MRINTDNDLKKLDYTGLFAALFNLSDAKQVPSDHIDEKHFETYCTKTGVDPKEYVVQLWGDGMNVDEFHWFLKMPLSSYQNDLIPEGISLRTDENNNVITWEQLHNSFLTTHAVKQAQKDSEVLLQFSVIHRNDGGYMNQQGLQALYDYAAANVNIHLLTFSEYLQTMEEWQ